MENTMKGMLVILMILYVISPIDACPGPVDDVIVCLLAMAASKKRA